MIDDLLIDQSKNIDDLYSMNEKELGELFSTFTVEELHSMLELLDGEDNE